MNYDIYSIEYPLTSWYWAMIGPNAGSKDRLISLKDFVHRLSCCQTVLVGYCLNLKSQGQLNQVTLKPFTVTMRCNDVRKCEIPLCFLFRSIEIFLNQQSGHVCNRLAYRIKLHYINLPIFGQKLKSWGRPQWHGDDSESPKSGHSFRQSKWANAKGSTVLIFTEVDGLLKQAGFMHDMSWFIHILYVHVCASVTCTL